MELAKLKIRKLNYKPGDTFLIMVPGPIAYETARRLKQYFEEHFPGAKALLFADGIEVVRRSKKTWSTNKAGKSPAKYRPSGGRSRTSHPKPL